MKFFLYIVLLFVLGGLVALFWNWAIDLFIDWPVTWGNWAKTWIALFLIRSLVVLAKD
jgi:hypothetical protein